MKMPNAKLFRFDKIPMLYAKLLSGELSRGFILTSSNNDLQVREAYQLGEAGRDERFNLDMIKES